MARAGAGRGRPGGVVAGPGRVRGPAGRPGPVPAGGDPVRRRPLRLRRVGRLLGPARRGGAAGPVRPVHLDPAEERGPPHPAAGRGADRGAGPAPARQADRAAAGPPDHAPVGVVRGLVQRPPPHGRRRWKWWARGDHGGHPMSCRRRWWPPTPRWSRSQNGATRSTSRPTPAPSRWCRAVRAPSTSGPWAAGREPLVVHALRGRPQQPRRHRVPARGRRRARHGARPGPPVAVVRQDLDPVGQRARAAALHGVRPPLAPPPPGGQPGRVR